MRKFLGLIILISSVQIVEGSHIRAGEIIARRIEGTNGLGYQFTFFGYRDQDGVFFGQGVFDFGDGNKWGDDDGEVIPWPPPSEAENLGNGVERWSFTLPYTYAGTGNYLVSYQEDFRNEGIVNMSGSATTAFYVETLIVIDPLFPNNTPFFTIPPIDQAAVGAVFEHDPGAVDPEGDSLAFSFVDPRQDLNLPVNGYRDLIDPSFYQIFDQGNAEANGEPTLTIDEFGTISWDAPGGVPFDGSVGPLEFNVAFVVEEWRKINGIYKRLGFVTRDMQIIVWNVENDPPELEIPEDTCVVAGDIVRGTAIGTDPDGDQLFLEALGEPFDANQVNPIATFSPDPPVLQDSPATLEFEWQTACGMVKAQPYQVKFKATDDPTIELETGAIIQPPGQVNFETWNITVVGPAPTGLVATKQTGRSINLDWDSYTCSNAESMQVWRRVGSFDLDVSCETGIPESAGYELINTVPINQTQFLDDNDGRGLSAGSTYCYRLVATFPQPLGGESIASEEACDSLLVDVPVITNVDIKQTDETNGVIEVRWVPPLEIDTTLFEPPYTYEVRRSIDGSSGSFETFDVGLDTFFVDNGINTLDETFVYQVLFYNDENSNPIDSSALASSVRLTPSPQVGGIRINWQASVPWSNNVQEFPYHLIYRDNISTDLDELVLIDSVDVTMDGFTYFDNGVAGEELDEETEYCYFITTRGSYSNDLLPEPLINSSQIICAQPNDTIPPCTPLNISFDSDFSCETQLIDTPCGVEDFQNVLLWNEDADPSCGSDLSFFRIYFSENGEEETFQVLGETTGSRFVHDNLSSLAGCYYITSVDISGNESERSEVFCNDNCPQYGLPNVFTPGDDDFNEVFKTLETLNECPRFVKSVVFKIFNRAGLELFSHDSTEPEQTIEILWDGKSNSGQELPAGVYYYSAELEYTTLNPENSNEVIKGWIQLIR